MWRGRQVPWGIASHAKKLNIILLVEWEPLKVFNLGQMGSDWF